MRNGLSKRVDLVEVTKIPAEKKLKKPVTVRIDKNTVVVTEAEKVDTKEKKKAFIERFKLNVERSRSVYL